MKTESDLVKDECITLLDRIFHGETLTFFGEDGNGRHGRSIFPVQARIRTFDFEIDAYSDDAAEIEASVRVFLDGYDSSVTGHAITDQNLRFDLNRLLAAWDAEYSTFDWADAAEQGLNFITLKVDVRKLLAW